MASDSTGARTGDARFPTTRWTVILEARDPDHPEYRKSLEELARSYWRPVYAYFRRKWARPHDEARDLAQDFFASLLEKNFLERLSAEHGRFRSYVMAALDNFARLQYRSQNRLKRGGGAAHFSLDSEEAFEPAAGATPEDAFLREWGHSILAQSVEELRGEYQAAGQQAVFEVFAARDLESGPDDDASYDALAKRFGLTVAAVTTHLYRARKKLRDLVLKRVRDTVSSEREAEAEMLELFEKRFTE